MEALIFEIADKHDHIANLRSKIRKLEERIEELERKVQFREKIIRELRRAPKPSHQHHHNLSHDHSQVDCNLVFITLLFACL